MEKVICKCGIGRGEVLVGALIDLPIQRVPGGSQAIKYHGGPRKKIPRRETLFSVVPQQLPRLNLRPLKGFLS